VAFKYLCDDNIKITTELVVNESVLGNTVLQRFKR